MGAALRKTTFEIDWKINNATLQQANQETDRMIQRAGQMEQNFGKSRTAIDSTTRSVRENNTSLSQASQRVMEFGTKSDNAYQKSSASAASAKGKVVDISDAYNRAGSAASMAGQKASTAATQTQRGMNDARGKVIDLRDRFSDLDNNITSMTDKASKNIQAGISKPLGAVKGILLGIGASAGVAGLGSMVNAGIDRLSAIEDAKLSLDVMMNDSDRAQKFMDKTLAFAKTTPYAFQNLATQAKNLLAYNMKESAVIPTLKAIGDLSAASGKGAEGLDTLGRAFGKMQVLGKVGMEELNSITESGVPALKILANSYKMPVQEMQKQISKGKVESTEAIKYLVDGIENGTKGIAGKTVALGGVMEKLKQTWKGSLDTMRSSVTSTMATLFEPIKPKLQAGMVWFAGEFKKLPDIVAGIQRDLKPAIGPTKAILHDMGEVIKDDVLPTAKNLATTMGPGFISGGVAALKVAGWTLNNVVAPPLKLVNKLIEENPEGMKKVGKFAAVGISAFIGFKVVSGIVGGVKRRVDSLVTSIARIGSTTTTAALQANIGMEAIDTAVRRTQADTIAGNILPDGVSRSSKSMKNRSFMSKLLGGTAKTDIALLESSGKKLNLLQKAKFGMSSTGAVGKLIGGAGILGVLSSATELIGMNKTNAGEKLGGFGGSLGGMAAGGAIGTAIAPGIGTAIGGAIGAFAGSSMGKKFGAYLQKEGPKLINSVKSGWSSISSWAEKHPILGYQVNAANKVMDFQTESWKKQINLAKKGWEEVKSLADKTLTVDAGGNGVSKKSAKAMNDYLSKEQSVVDKRVEIIATGRQQTKKEMNETISTYNAMAKQLTSATNQKASTDNKKWDKLADYGAVSNSRAASAKKTNNEVARINTADIKKNNKTLIKLTKEGQKEQENIAKKAEDRINAIKEKARKENRSKTSKENDEIKKIRSNAEADRLKSLQKFDAKQRAVETDQRHEATIALSKSAKEQKIILGNLQDSTSKMSAKAAASVVRNSAKQRDGRIKEAKKEYKETKKLLDEQLYVNKSMTKEEYKDALKKARDKREGVIDSANKMHKQVVKVAQKQAKDHLKEVDWETGETLSKWQQFKNSTIAVVGEFAGKAMGIAAKLATDFPGAMGSAVKMALGIWEGFKNSFFKVINYAITGVNKILNFFGMKAIPLAGASASIPKSQENSLSGSQKRKYHSTQTAGNLAMNYTGSNNASGKIMAGEEGFEIAYHKDSAKAQILGANGPEIANVAPGTKILNHHDSKKMMSGGLGAGTVLPGFAKGNTSIGDAVKNVAGKAVDKVKDVGSSIAGGFEAAWDFVSNPAASVKKLLSNRAGLSGNFGAAQLANGTIDYFGTQTTKWLKNKFSDLSAIGGPAGPAGGSAKAWSGIIKTAAKMMKVDLSGGELAGIIAQIQRESGGNQKITQSSAVVDVNTRSGNPARGLLQYIPQTFGAYAVKGHHNIYNGVDQLLAFFNNSNWRRDLPYGKSGWGPSGRRRFAKGGRPPVNQTVLVGENGPELFETDTSGTIHNARKTQQLLNKKSKGGTTINFNPTINITIEGGGSGDTQSKVKKAVQEATEEMFERLHALFNKSEEAF